MYDFLRMGAASHQPKGIAKRHRHLVAGLAWLGTVAVPGVATTAPGRTPAAVPARAPTQASGPQVDLASISRRKDRYVAALAGGGLAELTLDPVLQTAAEDALATHDVPFGAAVVVSVPDGRVLALAGRAKADPKLGPAALALRPWAPAASVFKVVAAAALVEEAGLRGTTRTCYHGGVSSVLPDNLRDVPRLDRRCDTLGYAVGKSQNAIIAKLAAKHLEPAELDRVARAFGFGQPLPFDAPLAPSTFALPEEPLEFARAAAGFWHSSLSVLHGALVAAAVANDGEMPMPRLIAKAIDAHARPLPLPRRRGRRVLDPKTAREVGRMMVETTRMGTAKGTFLDGRGRPIVPVEVAGKTGSLSYRGAQGDPALPAPLPAGERYLGYSWFVGFAPATRPKLAFAVLLGNSASWRIKAPHVARRLVLEHLAAAGHRRAANALATAR
jgi:cell division protein FtsI/penicillin-binding protein 2